MVKEDEYHPALRILINTSRKSPDHIKFITSTYGLNRHNYKKVTKATLYVEIGNIEWNDLYFIGDPEMACSFLYSKFYNVIDKVVPKFPEGNNLQKFSQWYSKELITKIKCKEETREKIRIEKSIYLEQ